MQRAVHRLHDSFDLLVIGGGIAGAWTAYDAALRGLRVALIEAVDWGAGTSSASSKLIHGGLRYLEHGDIRLVRTTLAERQRLLRLGPHRVLPLRFLLPLLPGTRRPAWQIRLGLACYDLLAGASATERHARLSADELTAYAPWCPVQHGGFAYSDAGTDDARLTLEIVAGATAAGAVAANHVRALALLRTARGEVVGAAVRDELSGRTCEVRARLTVNAAGPQAARLLLPSDRVPRIRRTKGVHLVLPPLPDQTTVGDAQRSAFLLTAPQDGRVFFLIPWYGSTLLGTTDTDHDDALPEVTAADRDYLLTALATRCPGLGFTAGDIRGSFAGLRVLREDRTAPGEAALSGASSVSREWDLAEPAPGLLQPVGGKLTAARAEAEICVDRVLARLGYPPSGLPSSAAGTRHPTRVRPLPWAPAEPWSAWRARQIAGGIRLGLDPETAATAASRYGTRIAILFARLAIHPGEASRCVPHVPMCRAELAIARSHEMACTDDDVVRRRVPLAILASPTDRSLGR